MTRRDTTDDVPVADLLGAAATTALAVVGFRGALDEISVLVVGAVGIVCGLAAAYASLRVVPGAALRLLAALVVFVITGCVALAVMGGTGSPAGLLDGVTGGWARLLTTQPPAGQGGGVLAIPLLCGYAGAMGAYVLARASRRPVCVLPPLAVLALAVLFGGPEPAALRLQGVGLAVVVLLWMRARQGSAPSAAVPRARAVPTAVTALAVTLLGLSVGPSLPLAGAKERFVLRDQVAPPLDLRQYASPLSGLRRWYADDRKDEELLRVSGLPPGQGLRLTVLDEYDGSVWNVSSGSLFVRVGTPLPEAVRGDETQVRVSSTAYRGVWVPAPDGATGVSFGGPRSAELSDAFRWSPGLSAGASTVELQPDDVVRISTVVPSDEAREGFSALEPETALLRPLAEELVPSTVQDAGRAAVGDARTAYDQATALAAWLSSQGYYSDGGPGTDVPAGHSFYRIESFLDGSRPLVGNAEQYAAAMALMATSLGLPARVVVGYTPVRPDVIVGRDVDAWVEVAFRGAGWLPFRPTPSRDRTLDETTSTEPQKRQVLPEPPPPGTAPPPPLLDDASEQALVGEKPRRKAVLDEEEEEQVASRLLVRLLLATAGVVTIPAAALLLVWLVKRRRSRRLRRGDGVAQVVGGWQHLLDVATDLRLPLPAGGTRREIAIALPVTAAQELAATADRTVFAAGATSQDEATAYWHQVRQARRALMAQVSHRDRLRALLSPASLRSAP